MTWVNRFGTVGLVLGALFYAAQLHAQQAPPEAAPSDDYHLKTAVRRVVVDVTVADPTGSPVHGLTLADFSLKEDGRPQRILTLEPHDMDVWSQVAPPNLPANTFVNLPPVPEQGPLYVFLYDMSQMNRPDVNGMTEFGVQMFARQQVVKFMESKPPGARFELMVVSDGLHLVQGFTQDRAKLLAGLDVQGHHAHMPMVFLYADKYPVSYLSVLNDITRYLTGLPGRKDLIWIAADFPLPLVAPASLDEIELTKRQLAVMAGEQIAVYPLDVGGVPSSAGEQMKFNREDEIAELTGGHAYYSNNNVAELLTKAVNESGTYYTLSYSSDNKDYSGGRRSIEVKLSNAQCHLAYRRYYYAGDDPQSIERPASLRPIFGWKKEPPAPPPDTLDTYMRQGMPMAHDLVFIAYARPVGPPQLATAEEMANLSQEPAYFRKRKKDALPKPLPPIPLQSYVIDYAVPAVQFHQPEKDAPQDTLEFAAAAFNQDGYLLNGDIVHATSTTKGQSTSYKAEQPFLAPVGASSVRLAVRDVATGRLGSLEIDLPLAAEPKPATKP